MAPVRNDYSLSQLDSLEAESIRDEKVKLLKSIRLMTPDQVDANVVRGQYTAGEIDGQPRPAYRHETTPVSVRLSALTAAASFGVLALSSIPVVRALGMVRQT